ncbi:uncharacterized protein METZ01_LOCUS112937, partial [marine metagenome]
MRRFPDAMALAWVTHHNRFYADVFEGNEELLCFSDRHIIVIFTMN